LGSEVKGKRQNRRASAATYGDRENRLSHLPDPRGGIRWIFPEKADYWT